MYYQVHRSIGSITKQNKNRKEGGPGKRSSGGVGCFFHIKRVKVQTQCSLESLLLRLRSRGLPRASARSEQLMRPALLLTAPPGRLLFPALTREAHALRPFPRQAEGRERVCCFSLFLSASHRAADRLRQPGWKASAAEQAPPPPPPPPPGPGP